jgi:hypothetical protein
MEGEAATTTPPPQTAAPGAGAQEPREAGATREWTPPTREFSAFVQSLESAPGAQGAGRGGGAETGGETSAPLRPAQATPRPARTTSPDADRQGASPAAAESGAYAESDADVEAGVDVEAGGDVESDAASPGEGRRRVARVREGTRARVERMREDAIVVLEETPDDSGLRFVAAAAALFLVFLVLLILSTTVLR